MSYEISLNAGTRNIDQSNETRGAFNQVCRVSECKFMHVEQL